MRAPTDNHPAAPSWRVKLLMTLAAWLVAFAIVTALLSVFGHQLAALPLAVRALVISGVLVTVMTRLALPAFDIAAARWRAGRHHKRSPAPQQSTPTRRATAPRDARAAQSAPAHSSPPQRDAAA
jgi:antibiotic biosynthesis monooxygenase (ABM) superfamily enzyme